MQKNKGLLLMNIGSPLSTEVSDVKKYLKTFLMDEEIITIPFLVRWPLVNLIIAPKRAPYSAENYKKVWMPEGSPIVVYTKRFIQGLQAHLPDYQINMGLQYSEPSITQALAEFKAKGIQEVVLAPMFPQWADATSKSALKSVRKALAQLDYNPRIQEVPPFYADSSFIETSARMVKNTLEGRSVDHYLMSYHGLPESHILRDKECKLDSNCCSLPSSCARNCYRAQCLKTSELIAGKLGLQKDQYTTCFQSRLGRAQWIKPSTEDTIRALAEKGVKSLAVICPSFVSDCIETLEEIGMGGRETFQEHGGKDYHLVPCVNDDAEFIQGFARIVQNLKEFSN